jgi:two-component system, NarL family, response regulator DevR
MRVEATMQRKKILVVDDHEIVRVGLKALINRQANLEVVGEATDAPEAVAETERLKPDVVLMDIRLGDTSGIDGCQRIMSQWPETKVIMLTSYAEDEMLFAAVRTGAAGYVVKQSGGQEVIRAIQAALDGATLLDPAAAESIFNTVRRAARSPDCGAFAGLNGQEQRVLARITTGDTNREIARRLHLGEGTVRNYVSNILEKLNVANRAEAAAYATKHKLHELLVSD